MRSIKKGLLFTFAAVGMAFITPSESEAQTFPTSTWVPLTRGLAIIGAGINSGASDDIVGDTTASGAAAYIQSDADFLYLRIRVNADPTASGAIRTDRLFGCEIDTDNDQSYELFAFWDGSSNQIRLGTIGATQTGSRSDGATGFVNQAVGGTYPNGQFGRVVAPAGSTTSGNPDAFVDIAIARTALGTTAAAYKPLKFACGIGAVAGGARSLDVEVFDPNPASGLLATVWSDPFVCSATGCLVDRDRDGVPDSVETLGSINTDPLDPDSDNDNIDDARELSASGFEGPFTAIDTDGDGVIDAKDTDSDNDCVDDLNEGTGAYRTANTQAYLQCVGTPLTPACSKSTGDCAKCDGPNNGTTPAKCPTTGAPACFADGSCKTCGPGQTQNCTTAQAPACNASGACVACTGDFGATTAAPCPSSGAPACHTSGPLFGQCKTCSRANGAACTTAAAPACDTTLGTCGTCNGDKGGVETKPCTQADAPTCHIVNAGATGVGTCFKCTNDNDCLESSKHNGPTCNVATGECFDTDSDGDGLSDAIEINLGTDKTKQDSDGDGISDNIEARPNGGGSPAKVDTDGDGTIDALDTDSDNDTVLDSAEGTTDTDADSAPNFRDPDDDADGIPTSIEVVDGQVAKVSDDVDMDGQKNWLDKDSDGNGVEDGTEGRGDEDLDGIPDYLDTFKDPVKMDAGATSSSGGSSGTPNPVDGGFTSTEEDASVPRFDAGPIEEGVVEGTGLFCGRSTGRSGLADIGVIVFGAFVALSAARRRRRR